MVDLDAELTRFRNLVQRLEPVIPVLLAQIPLAAAGAAVGGPAGGAAGALLGSAGGLAPLVAEFDKLGGAGILKRIVDDVEKLKAFQAEVAPLVGTLRTVIEDLKPQQVQQQPPNPPAPPATG
jgi:hypothetical protein